MRIDLYHHIESGGVDRKLDAILSRLTALLAQGATVTPELQRVKDAVSAQTTVLASAETLLGQLGDLVRANADNPTELAKLADQIDQQRSELATAVTANTPAAPVV